MRPADVSLGTFESVVPVSVKANRVVVVVYNHLVVNPAVWPS